jgi:hypothetical protein
MLTNVILSESEENITNSEHNHEREDREGGDFRYLNAIYIILLKWGCKIVQSVFTVPVMKRFKHNMSKLCMGRIG